MQMTPEIKKLNEFEIQKYKECNYDNTIILIKNRRHYNPLIPFCKYSAKVKFTDETIPK